MSCGSADLRRGNLAQKRHQQCRHHKRQHDRSERIRTYNFPQGRVTDHRINLTLYNLARVIEGEALDDVINPLIAEDQAARLASYEILARVMSETRVESLEAAT